MRRLAVMYLAALCLTAATADEPLMTLTARERFPVRAFEGLQPLPLQVDLHAGESSPTEVTLVVTLADFDGVQVARQESTLDVRPGSARWVAFGLTPPDFGYYKAAIQALDADQTVLAHFGTAFAALPPTGGVRADAATSVFGVNVHFDQNKGDIEALLRMMDLAGVRWERDTVDWPSVERRDGVYAIPAANRAAWEQARQRYGIRTLGVLCYGHPLHGRAPDRFGAYSRETARLLAGTVDDFEVWNEPSGFGNVPPEEYAGILEASYVGVKTGNPQATVVGLGGAAPGGWSGWYLPEIIKLGKHGFMDTFSIHPYCSPSSLEVGYATDGAPAPLANLDYGNTLTGGALAAIQQAHGGGERPRMWITEVGWPTTQTSLAGQAQAVSRAFLSVAALPDLYARMFLYDFLCDGNRPTEMEDNFGLLENDYSVRPSYVALANTSRAIDGRPFLRRLPHPDPAVRLYLFGPQDAPLLAAWCTEVSPEEVIASRTADGQDARALNRVGGRLDRAIEVELTTAAAEVALTDWQGRESRQAVTDGRLRLRLTTWPVYVRGLGDASTFGGTGSAR